MTKKYRIPRKLKKRIKGAIILFDLASLPNGLCVDEWYRIYKTTGVMLYEGEKPHVIARPKEIKYSK